MAGKVGQVLCRPVARFQTTQSGYMAANRFASSRFLLLQSRVPRLAGYPLGAAVVNVESTRKPPHRSTYRDVGYDLTRWQKLPPLAFLPTKPFSDRAVRIALTGR